MRTTRIKVLPAQHYRPGLNGIGSRPFVQPYFMMGGDSEELAKEVNAIYVMESGGWILTRSKYKKLRRMKDVKITYYTDD